LYFFLLATSRFFREETYIFCAPSLTFFPFPVLHKRDAIFLVLFTSKGQDLQLVQTAASMYNNISLCFILLFGGSMIRSVDPQHTTKELAIMKAFMEKCQFLLDRKTIEYVYDAFSPSISHTLSGFPCSSLIDGRRKTESDFFTRSLDYSGKCSYIYIT